MQLQTTFELSMVLDNEKFHKVLTRAYNNAEYLDENEDEYVDQSLVLKGITVTYRDSQYKKKVQLIIHSNLVLGDKSPDPDKLTHKLDKYIDGYFGSKYGVGDFTLSGMVLSTDIKVSSREDVVSYLKILQRVSKVKGFSPTSYECFDGISNFCLEGNSNGIDFWVYDLEALFAGKLQKKLRSMHEEIKGILRAEVRLTKPKAIRAYTNETSVSRQIAELSKNSWDVFFDTFTRVAPFGDYYKKEKAIEIIQSQVTDSVLRRRMLHLLMLIPERKSLLLAQKALNYRRIDDVMEAFARINVSPITISKRHDVKHLKCLYSYLFDEKQ